MDGLAIMYSKELIRELDMIPVYYPGTPVKPGDVISFKHFNIFGKPQPIGTFTKEASLSDYINIDTESDKDPQPIRFASRDGVSVEFDGNVDVGALGKGQLKISFTKAGTIFLAATGMGLERIKDLDQLKRELVRIKNKFTGDWNKSFIVTSVRVASRAIVMQSGSASGSLTIDGEAKNIQPGSPAEIDASIKLSVSAFKDASCLKDWSKNVEVFFGLSHFRQKGDGSVTLKHRMAPTVSTDWELSSVYPDEVDFSAD